MASPMVSATAAGLIREGVLQVGRDRQVGCRDDDRGVDQCLLPAHRAVVAAQRGGEAGARGGQRLEAQGREQPGRAEVPRVRQQEGFARPVQGQELACLVRLSGHGP